MLIDTSVWIDIFRDRSGQHAEQLEALTRGREIYLSRYIQMELLQGAANEHEWHVLDDYLDTQLVLSDGPESWRTAARLYFDLRRVGKTVRSTIDCCIAQVAIEHEVLLLHRDRDFQNIALVSDLNETYIEWV